MSRAAVVGGMGMVLRGSLSECCWVEAVCAAADLSEDPSCQQCKELIRLLFAGTNTAYTRGPGVSRASAGQPLVLY